jgi:hypothetical protein
MIIHLQDVMKGKLPKESPSGYRIAVTSYDRPTTVTEIDKDRDGRHPAGTRRSLLLDVRHEIQDHRHQGSFPTLANGVGVSSSKMMNHPLTTHSR